MGKKISFKNSVRKLLDDKKVQISSENFICIEILLQIISDTKQKPKDGWVLLTQYYKYLLSSEFIELYGKRLYFLRKKCHHLSNKLNWGKSLEEYFNIDANLRLFSIDNKILVKQPLKYLVDRQSHYEKLLDTLMNPKLIKPFFPNTLEVKYSKVIRNFIKYSEKTVSKIEESLVINKKFREIDNEKLQLYKEKKRLSLQGKFSWKDLYKEMGTAWENRPIFKIINEFNDGGEKVIYKDNLHIVGEVGQGKSNYKIAETYRLVKEYSANVGIIESKVDDVIKTTKVLRKLGIDVVPIIGNSNIDKHLSNYIKNAGKKAINISDFSKDEFKELEYLSGICTIGAIAGDNDILPNQFPCKKLYDDEDNKKICPVYNKCGYYKRFLELPKAKVWVATPHSLINMTIPKVIDPYERTFYEAFHDLLDVIIVDEADSVQRTLDSLFLIKEDLVGNGLTILDMFTQLDELIAYKNLINNESLAYTWHMNFGHLNLLIPKVNRMVSNSEVLHAYLRREVITSFSLFSDIKEGLKVDEYEKNREILKKLEQYFEYTNTYDITNESIKHEFNELYTEFIWIQNIGLVEEKIREKIINLFERYKVIIPKNKNKELFYAKFELFIYLVQLDFYFKVLSRDYPILMEEINNNYEKINVYEGTRRALRTFLTEPMTGVIFGYKFIPESKSNSQKLIIFRYSGVGRRLLDHYHELKKEIGLQGPAIVLLSGTSVAPGSGHFNLRESPEYILKSFDQNIKIDQKLLCKYSDGDLIKISGLNGEERSAALRKLTKALIRDIRMELKYWKDKSKIEIKDRKVLLIVNSYDNCQEVGKVLKDSGITYRLLSRQTNDSYDLSKELLEDFQQETDNAEVLVAPLNVISRGYNILNSYGKSYFGSIFFMIRPYMVPDDLESYFEILHSNLDNYIRKAKSKTSTIGEAMNEIRRLSYIDLLRISQNRYWKTLDPEFRRNLAWFTLIPMKQAIGRLQRGGTDCRVFYCDGSFVPELSKGELITRENSMLMEWYKILDDNMDNIFVKELYGKFFNGLEKLVEDINNKQLEDEYFGK